MAGELITALPALPQMLMSMVNRTCNHRRGNPEEVAAAALPALLGLWLWREPGLEDRPSNFGSPQRVVSGIGGADEVVLANRPGGRKLMLGHVSGEGTVSPVDFGAGTEASSRSGAWPGRSPRWTGPSSRTQLGSPPMGESNGNSALDPPSMGGETLQSDRSAQMGASRTRPPARRPLRATSVARQQRKTASERRIEVHEATWVGSHRNRRARYQRNHRSGGRHR